MKILGSASKIVFILLTITACIGFYFGILESKDFMLLAISAFSYYFTKVPTPTESVTTSKTVTTPPADIK